MLTSDKNNPIIELQDIRKVYGTGGAAMYALRGINMRIDLGEFVAVMGPSGSGKSTCMNILGCLDTASSGTFLFKGVDVGKLDRNQRALLRRHYLGFVFQGYNLLNRTSALENVELPLIYRGTHKRDRRRRSPVCGRGLSVRAGIQRCRCHQHGYRRVLSRTDYRRQSLGLREFESSGRRSTREG